MEWCDLIFPIPPPWDTSVVHSATHRWYFEQLQLPPDQQSYYTVGTEWVVDGDVSIYTKDRTIIHEKHVELRFGEHPYMQGFRFCLKAQFANDDKHEIAYVRADSWSQTITGRVRSSTFVFRPYLFQFSRLSRLMKTIPIEGLDSLLGSHMVECNKTLDSQNVIKK